MNKKLIKVLVIGKEPIDFVGPMIQHMNEQGIRSEVVEFRDSIPGSVNPLSSLFDLNNYSVIELIACLFKRQFWTYFFSLKDFKSAIRLNLLSQYFLPLFELYDCINFQCLEPLNLDLLRIVPEGKKIVCSFWGSDLNTMNKSRVEILTKYLTKANAITLHGPEMRELLLEKYPFVNKEKIYLQLFGVRNDFFKSVNSFTNSDLVEAYKRKLKIPDDKVICMVSYCAKPVSNQLKIINELHKLDAESSDKLYFIIPATYSNPDYKAEVLNRLETSDLSYTCFEEFLPLEELIFSKLISDIYIHANVSDAFSNSMLENLFCSSIGIIADWLPYLRLTEAGVYTVPFSEFGNLNSILKEVLFNLEEYKVRISQNPRIIKDTFGQDAIVQDWHKMFLKINE